jgi:hypothetical protein
MLFRQLLFVAFLAKFPTFMVRVGCGEGAIVVGGTITPPPLESASRRGSFELDCYTLCTTSGM